LGRDGCGGEGSSCHDFAHHGIAADISTQIFSARTRSSPLANRTITSGRRVQVVASKYWGEGSDLPARARRPLHSGKATLVDDANTMARGSAADWLRLVEKFGLAADVRDAARKGLTPRTRGLRLRHGRYD
jgi:hypothetical protein